MSTKIKGLTVAFDCEVSEEFCDNVINAIKMIAHVGDVIPLETTHDDIFAKTQLRYELRDKFFNFMKNELK